MELAPHSDPGSTDPLNREEKLSPIKLTIAQYVVASLLAVLVVGLWRLQIVSADGYRVLAEANRVRKVPVLAPRGRLLDREGRLLVDNYPSVTCYLLREQVKDLDADIALISQGLHIPVEQINATLRRFQLAPKYEPIPLKQDITPDEQAFIAAHRNELPELETLDEQRRLYPRDGFAAHLIGYVGEISEQMLDTDSRYAFYQPGDMVGRSGVEQTYDAILRGKDGSRDVIVNSHGKEIGQLGYEQAVAGQNLKLTIDLDVQMAAEKALEGKTGAIVAMDPHTGEILALASRPTFDPNQFSVRVSRSYWSGIINNPDHPLLNKAIQAQMAPGSTFKIIMSVAGLQENVAPDHARRVLRRSHLSTALLRLRQTPRHGRHQQRHPLVLRHLLLHPRQPPRHRHHRQIRYLARLLPEDRRRPPRRGLRHHALHRLEAQDPARKVVRR